MRKLQRYLLGALVTAGLVLGSAVPAAAQRRGGQAEHRNQPERRAQIQQRSQHENYYNGMQSSVRQGDYARYARNDERRDHRDKGGIGPGTGAAIGGVGGAVLGAIFGGGLKGTLIGGAAGAGIGAIVGEATKGNDHNRRGGHR